MYDFSKSFTVKFSFSFQYSEIFCNINLFPYLMMADEIRVSLLPTGPG